MGIGDCFKSKHGYIKIIGTYGLKTFKCLCFINNRIVERTLHYDDLVGMTKLSSLEKELL